MRDERHRGSLPYGACVRASSRGTERAGIRTACAAVGTGGRTTVAERAEASSRLRKRVLCGWVFELVRSGACLIAGRCLSGARC